jgi:hypothetical protein
MNVKSETFEVTIENIDEILNKIRQHKNLKRFQDDYNKKFCEKYNITMAQFNFLLSVVAVERLTKNKIQYE